MTNRVYDSSFLTMRKAEKAVANSFLSPYGLTANTQYMRGSQPLLGIKDSSIMYAVKTGGMTEYKRFSNCYGIDVGCPCAATNASVIAGNPALPGFVSGIVFTVGSIIVSWQAPVSGVGPFSYTVVPYLNGVALPAVSTSNLSYRFTDLEEGMPYTFTVCAVNSAGAGPAMMSTAFLAPPENLSLILQGSNVPVDVAPSMMYILNAGLNTVLSYAASINMGPTIASRLMYVWVASVVQAWNWVATEKHVAGVQDGWNWDTSKAGAPLSSCDAILWLSTVIDYVTPILVPAPYRSIYVYSAADVTRVQAAGNWSAWLSAWSAWFSARQADGAATAATTMPVSTATATLPISATPLAGAANWLDATNSTIVVDGVTVAPIATFPQPQGWTRLTVMGHEQKYLTWLWDSVTSTCLSAANEQEMSATVAPVTGAARDAEIDSMMTIVASLTDAQKVQAELWAGSAAGSVSPPHMFIWLWKEYVRMLVCPCDTVVYSLLDLAIHLFETGRVVWGIKALYMQDRPIQEVRRRYAGQKIASWNSPSGAIDGAQWIPYQRPNFVTPPFPDFVSGHSGFSKGFALTMAKWFGPNVTKTATVYDNLPLFAPVFVSQQQQQAYGDFVVNAGASLVQTGTVPAAPTTVSFATWEDMATSAGMSRLYGGIHTIAAHTASQTVAVEVDGFIGTSWGISTTAL